MTQAELDLFYWFNHRLASPQLDVLMSLLSSTAFWLSVGIGVSLHRLYRQRGSRQGRGFLRVFLLFAATLILTDMLSYYGLKDHLLRLRPCHELADVRLAAAPCGGQYGLPSNHAANSMAVFTLWYLLFGYRRKFIALCGLLMVLAVCLSRVYLGVHYPSDIGAGFLVGALMGSIAAGFARTWLNA